MSLSATSTHVLNTSREGDSPRPWEAHSILDHPFHEEILNGAQLKPPLAQFETISSHHSRQESDALLAAASFQAVVEQ